MDEIIQLYMNRNFDVALKRSRLFLSEIAGLDHSLTCKGRSCACFPGICITLQLFAEWLGIVFFFLFLVFFDHPLNLP